MRKAISIDSWLDMVHLGADVPANTLLSGSSMEPLIRMDKDIVTVMPLKRDPKRGDIVLFKRGDGAYVVHRVMKVTENTILTMGDNCIAPDAPLQKSQILGIVTQITRKEGNHHRIIDPYDDQYTKYGEKRLRQAGLRKRKRRYAEYIRVAARRMIKGK